MTSKDIDDDGVASPSAIAAYADRTALDARVRAGELPDIDHLLAGCAFFGGELKRDRTVWCDSWLLGTDIDKLQSVSDKFPDRPQLRPLIQNLRDTGSNAAAWLVEHAMRQIGHDSDADRMLVYAACSDDADARLRLVASSRRQNGWMYDDFDRLFTTATVVGMVYGRRADMSGYCKEGLRILSTDALAQQDYDRAVIAAALASTKLDAVVAAITDEDFDVDDVLEDRAEIVREDGPEGLVVVPTLPEATTGFRKEIVKGWKSIAGNTLLMVRRGDVAAHRASLVAQWPHAVDIIDTILGDLAARDAVHFRPTLLVGSPGSGKSSLARAIFDQVGIPCELQSFAGLHDAALMGTSAQWGSAREAAPLQLIKRTSVPNPGLIWDEIEKASADRRNGAPAEALLAFLEPDQARRYRDLCLEVECDLSAVSHFATANSLEGVPRPVVDRMRVLTMPEPGWQHLGVLTRQIVDRIARERGIDQRWFAPLAEDELDLVRQAWPGGSIRQLTRIVTTIVDGRDRIIGRC